MHIHTHIKELLALNTVHVPVFLHTRTQQLRVAPDENQIKTIKLFKYEKMQVKLSTPNNSTYIDAHTGHFMRSPAFVPLWLCSP